MKEEVRNKARVFRNNGSQMVRLPKGFQFEESEVYICREGDAVVLSLRPRDWSLLLGSDTGGSKGLMSSAPKSHVFGAR